MVFFQSHVKPLRAAATNYLFFQMKISIFTVFPTLSEWVLKITKNVANKDQTTMRFDTGNGEHTKTLQAMVRNEHEF